MEFRAVVAGVLALVFTSVRVALGSGSIPPTVRHPQLPHVCDSGPLRGCACSPTEDDPNGICSDAPFEEPFFEIGPQCLPVLLDGPRATATLTYMIDDYVDDYQSPPDVAANRAFTVLLEVKAPNGIHLLSETYQNIEDPAGPLFAWGFGGQPSFDFDLDEAAAGFFFDDPRQGGIEGFLRNWKPLLYYSPRPQLAERLRTLLNAPPGSVPVIINNILDHRRVRFEDNVDNLATVVRVKVKIGFIPAEYGTCGDGVVDRGPVCESSTDVSLVAGAEACDDGNPISTDSCIDCHLPQCGDGAIWAGFETCDPPGSGQGCDSGKFCANDCASCTEIPPARLSEGLQ